MRTRSQSQTRDDKREDPVLEDRNFSALALHCRNISKVHGVNRQFEFLNFPLQHFKNVSLTRLREFAGLPRASQQLSGISFKHTAVCAAKTRAKHRPHRNLATRPTAQDIDLLAFRMTPQAGSAPRQDRGLIDLPNPVQFPASSEDRHRIGSSNPPQSNASG